MAERSVTAVLASLGMQYGFTSFELAKVATDLATGRSDEEIVHDVHAGHRDRLRVERVNDLVAQVKHLVETRPTEVDAWVHDVHE